MAHTETATNTKKRVQYPGVHPEDWPVYFYDIELPFFLKDKMEPRPFDKITTHLERVDIKTFVLKD